MRRTVLVALGLLALPAIAGSPGAVEDLGALLEPIRAKHRLPALAGSIVADARTIAIGATGVRARGADDPVTPADRWHLGSCTKAMTATLAALLVEEGAIAWETTLGEVFPDETATGREAWRAVTLEQLLRHRSGLPEDRDPRAALWPPHSSDPLPTQRRDVLRAGLARRPASIPDGEIVYSNAGYVIAAAMLEARTGKAWEDLMRERIFAPLGMASAGFGPPAPLPQPQGHRGRRPVGIGPDADNPPVIGPAGRVHASLEDWGRFVALHLRGPAGESDLLSPASFERLHAREPHGMGWMTVDRPWGGRVLTHAGSNTAWYAVVWAAPERGFAVLVATNEAGDDAFPALDAAAGALIAHHLSR